MEKLLRKIFSILLVLLFLSTNIASANNLSDLIKKISLEQQVEFSLLYAICSVESNFNPKAIGDGGRSKGLGQIQDATAITHNSSLKNLNEEELHNYLLNPKNNIRLIAKIIKGHLNRYDGDIIYALAAYNAGTKNIDKAYAEKRNPFNSEYVSKILNAKKSIEQNYIFILKDYIVINSPIKN